MRHYFLLVSVFLPLLFLCQAGASEFTCFESAVGSGNADAWKAVSNGRATTFWADTSGDGTPDIFFALHDDRYRQVQIDENADGAAELILLFDQEKGYHAYQDSDRDGYWESRAKWEFESGQSKPSKAQSILLEAVERRIFLDGHSDRWKPCAGSVPPNGFSSSVAFQSYRMTFRLTRMSTSLKDDPERNRKPLALPEINAVVTPGQETNLALESMQLNDDLLFEGRPAKQGSLFISLFALPFTEAPYGDAGKTGAVLQVSGRLDVEKEGKNAFSSLIPLMKGSNYASTVPLYNEAGKEAGSMFIEIFLNDKQKP